MNFLSHFYFDRYTTDPYHVTGTVLPDLLKNADKSINIHPEKMVGHQDVHINSLIEGWKRHLEVDRHFHSSEFFAHHSHQLKLALTPAIETSPVKPFFLGHVALELILDNLLLTTGNVKADKFYDHLDMAKSEPIHNLLVINNMLNTETFFNFFANFKKHRYLNTYTQTPQVAYALKRVCMRIWKDPFTEAQEEKITGVIVNYRSLLLPGFMSIFDDIERRIN